MEWDLSVGLDDDVAGLASGLGAYNALHRFDLAQEWLLVVEGVDGHVRTLKACGDLCLLALLNSDLLSANAQLCWP